MTESQPNLPGRFDILTVLRDVLRVKFGPGAIGRIGSVVLGGVVALVVLSVFLVIKAPAYAPLAVGAPFLILVLFLVGAFTFAFRHPDLAALSGAQMERVLLQDSAAKRIPGDPLIVDIARAPIPNPIAEAIEEKEDDA